MRLKILLQLLVLLVLERFLSSHVWSRQKKQEHACTGKHCTSITVQVFLNGDHSTGFSAALTWEDCASLQDLGALICPRLGHPATCLLYSAWGTRATSCTELKNGDHLFIVPPGRLYQLPVPFDAKNLGRRTSIHHIGTPVLGKPITLEVLSQHPRLLKISNFFTEEEADALIHNARTAQSPSHRLQRSSTGQEHINLNRGRNQNATADTDNRRISDTAFDTSSEVAARLKRRAFDLLGIFPFDDSMADGFQILRYNRSGAYGVHMDWIEPPAAPAPAHSLRPPSPPLSAAATSHSDSLPSSNVAAVGVGAQSGGSSLGSCVDGSTAADGSQTCAAPSGTTSSSSSSKKSSSRRERRARRRAGLEAGTGSMHPSGDSTTSPAVHTQQKKHSDAEGWNEGWNEGSKEELIEPEHDWDSAREGTNRFATLMLYLTDVEIGGETVFPLAGTHEEELERERESSARQRFDTQHSGEGFDDAATGFRWQLEGNMFSSPQELIAVANITKQYPKDSWQRRMIVECRTRLIVKPKRLEALLFYSQKPDGRPDYTSVHGGCPVVHGEKWVATLWVWNGPRRGYWRKSEDGKPVKPSMQSISATFEAADVTGASLFWEDQLWDVLLPGRPIKVNTFAGHRWNIRMLSSLPSPSAAGAGAPVGEGSGGVGGETQVKATTENSEVVLTWLIEAGKSSQRFQLTTHDVPPHLLLHSAQ